MDKPLFWAEPEEQQDDLEQFTTEAAGKLNGLLADSGRKLLSKNNNVSESLARQNSLRSSSVKEIMEQMKKKSIKKAAKDAAKVVATKLEGSKAVIVIACVVLVVLLLSVGIFAIVGVVSPSGKNHPSENDMITYLSVLEENYQKELQALRETPGPNRIEVVAEKDIPWNDILSIYYVYWLEYGENEDISWVSTLNKYKLDEIFSFYKNLNRETFDYIVYVSKDGKQEIIYEEGMVIDNIKDYNKVTKQGLRYTIEWRSREEVASMYYIKGDNLSIVLGMTDDQWQWVYDGLKK